MTAYTRDQIKTLEKQELSIAVAEHVMGFELGAVTMGGCIPAEDISVAWEVVEKLNGTSGFSI